MADLHHTEITAGAATPACWMLVLHGIYGSGQNWRTFARKLTARRPDWGLVLVDLRKHGQSQDLPGPHTVAAAAADLQALAGALTGRGQAVRAVFGHSFGGKVALAYRAAAGPRLMQTWVIDATPSARPEARDDSHNTVAQVLNMLSELPSSFRSRDDFVRQVQERGFAPALGQWLAMNLEHRDGEYVSRIDVAAMDELLRDYYQLDSWPAVESGPGEVHVVVAGKSTAISPDDRRRLADLAARDARISTTVIEDSGHWVHIEALDTLLEVVASGLPRC